MNKIFIDTNFIVAIFRENEEKHTYAVETCQKLLTEYECYISNSIMLEVITIVMMRTKNMDLTIKAYYFMKDNFNIINEYEIPYFNDKVMQIFQKYNKDKFNLGFTDCSIPVITEHYNIPLVISFDKNFKLISEISLY